MSVDREKFIKTTPPNTWVIVRNGWFGLTFGGLKVYRDPGVGEVIVTRVNNRRGSLGIWDVDKVRNMTPEEMAAHSLDLPPRPISS